MLQVVDYRDYQDYSVADHIDHHTEDKAETHNDHIEDNSRRNILRGDGWSCEVHEDCIVPLNNDKKTV